MARLEFNLKIGYYPTEHTSFILDWIISETGRTEGQSRLDPVLWDRRSIRQFHLRIDHITPMACQSDAQRAD